MYNHPCPEACQTFHPGHQMHWIHTKHLARTPWGWREGIVASMDSGTVVVRYVESDASVEVGHHRALPVEPGTPVRVHERLHALDVAGFWFNLEIHVSGLGPVPEPEAPELWAAEVPTVITDLGAGIGLAVPRDG